MMNITTSSRINPGGHGGADVCTVKLDRLQFMSSKKPDFGLLAIWNFSTKKDRFFSPKGQVQTYLRVRELHCENSDARLYLQYARAQGYLPHLKATLVADDRTGITPDELLDVVYAFPNRRFILAEVAFDFTPDSGVNQEFVRRHCMFGKSRPHPSKKFPNTLYYGERGSEKFVRCYFKPPYRVELELHSAWIRKWRITEDQEELFQHLADDLCPAHIRFVEFNWPALEALLTHRGIEKEPVLREARARAGSLHELQKYLRETVGVHNPHRFLTDLPINKKIQKALRNWANEFSLKPNTPIAKGRFQMYDPKTRALRLLQSPDFFCQFLEAVKQTGLIREKKNALITYIVAVSRLLPDPLQLFIKGGSSAGKNFLARTVLEFLPRSHVHTVSTTSATALNYQGKRLSHKVLYFPEQNVATGSVHPTRWLISEKELIREVTVRKGGKLTTKRYVTKGPVAAISTTTEDRLKVDDESRRVSTWIDESAEQTRQIIKGSWTQRRGVLTPDELRTWHFVQRLLAERAKLPVELPSWFASLADLVTSRDLRLRRYAPAFKEACKAVCLVRSFQRPAEKVQRSGKVRVGFADVAIAQLIFDSAFAESLRGGDDEDDMLLEVVERYVKESHGAPPAAWWVANELRISKDKAYQHLREAVRKGFLIVANKPVQTNLKQYLPAPPPTFLPEPRVIHRKLGLKGRYGFIDPFTGDWVVIGNPRGNG